MPDFAGLQQNQGWLSHYMSAAPPRIVILPCHIKHGRGNSTGRDAARIGR
jgi:hypothetical protein